MKLRVLDLFSGIGGFSLGLERAKLEGAAYDGFETVAFCEIEEFPRKVLAKHWPGVPCYRDVRELTAEQLAADGIAVDAICGGFPCQDISAAGGKAGLTGERSGLWKDYARLVSELRPRVVVVENVADLLSRGLGQVLGDLAALGYDAEWHCIPASHIGAPHRRDRLWLVSYPQGRGKQEFVAGRPQAWGFSRRTQWSTEPAVGRVAYGVPNRPHRLAALGNAVVPQIPELIGNAILRALAEERVAA